MNILSNKSNLTSFCFARKVPVELLPEFIEGNAFPVPHISYEVFKVASLHDALWYPRRG